MINAYATMSEIVIELFLTGWAFNHLFVYLSERRQIADYLSKIEEYNRG